MAEPLTKKQQELVDKNHNLIYGFANKMNLSIEEYYGILAIGMCKAASVFDETKGTFSTVAFRCMRNELNHYWSYLKKKSAIPSNMIFYYDVPIREVMRDAHEDENNFLSIISDKNNTHDIALSNMMLETFLVTLTEKEKHVVKLLMEGIMQSEIADMLNCSRQCINNNVMSIRNKFKRLFEYN